MTKTCSIIEHSDRPRAHCYSSMLQGLMPPVLILGLEIQHENFLVAVTDYHNLEA